MDNYWKVSVGFVNQENYKVVNEYLLNMKIENKSFHTINNIRYFLQHFFEKQAVTFSSLKSETIQEWFIKNDTGFKKNTIRFHLSALSTFYTFCVEEGYMEKSPIKSRWFPISPKPIPKYLNKEELAKVRRETENFPLRDRAIVEFMVTSGCRIGEVNTLDRAHINLEDRTANVLGKGKKFRQVHFTERAAILIERYLQSREDDNPALFVSSKEIATRLSIRRIGRIFNRIGENVGLPSSLHPHRLRHTFATDLLAKGADLIFIADELGHSDIKTTQIYARLPKQEIIALYRKYMG